MNIVIGVIMVSAVAVAIVLPLLRGDPGEAERPDERVEQLQHEKAVALLAIREADFDRATGKLSDDDYAILRSTYEQRALGVLRQLDTLASAPAVAPEPAAAGTPAAFCPSCGRRFSDGDRFCAGCGARRPLLTQAAASGD